MGRLVRFLDTNVIKGPQSDVQGDRCYGACRQAWRVGRLSQGGGSGRGRRSYWLSCILLLKHKFLDGLPVTKELVVVVVAAQASTDLGEVLHELDPLDPFDHFES